MHGPDSQTESSGLRAAEGQTFEASQAAKAIQGCARQLEERFDAQRGGFGEAPKFPRPAEINLLHVAHLRDSFSDQATSSSSASTSGAYTTVPLQALRV